MIECEYINYHTSVSHVLCIHTLINIHASFTMNISFMMHKSFNIRVSFNMQIPFDKDISLTLFEIILYEDMIYYYIRIILYEYII